MAGNVALQCLCRGLLLNLLAWALPIAASRYGHVLTDSSDDNVELAAQGDAASASRAFMAGRKQVPPGPAPAPLVPGPAVPGPPPSIMPPAPPAPAPAPAALTWQDAMVAKYEAELTAAANAKEYEQIGKLTTDATIAHGEIHAAVQKEQMEAVSVEGDAYKELAISDKELDAMEGQSLAHAQEMLDRGTKEARIEAKVSAEDEIKKVNEELAESDDLLTEHAEDIEEKADELMAKLSKNRKQQRKEFKNALKDLPIEESNDVMQLAEATQMASKEVMQSANAARGMSKLVNKLAMNTIAMEEDATVNAKGAQQIQSETVAALHFNDQQLHSITVMADSTIKDATKTASAISASR